MKQQHPTTPPPELVQQWVAEIWHEGTPVQVALSDEHIATRAAQWGADQELEACLCEVSFLNSQALADRVRAARRHKPPSLKEQSLKHLDVMERDGHYLPEILQDLRRAVEMAPDQ
jgi:hypothetical protein